MSTNIQWQSFKLTESDRANIKNQQLMNYNIRHMKNDFFIAMNKTLKMSVVA